ncbi:hypothetical protein CCUS01_14214 [Colletotrichum cuscutae]|uniref:Oligonucleotide transporter n=1 Tax=Colletotrichum cuscutae TaxID=1209917 RepID=A0AAI9Y9P2_9PEZI|nr:hypothetical protein CCUS01_14214 [Colletotrichum cuscutae]
MYDTKLTNSPREKNSRWMVPFPKARPCFLRKHFRKTIMPGFRDIEAASRRHRRASTSRSREQEMLQPASSLTLRSTAVGIIVGFLICLSNTYFGLRTGFLAIMSLPSTILGFAFFKMVQDHLAFPFTPQEHATMVVIASSLGLMPFTIGSVGILPAMEFLTNESENGPFRLDWSQLCVWSIGVSILGVAVTLPLRKRFLVQEPLPFPFGTSSAAMIGSLHRDTDIADRILRAQNDLDSTNDKQKPSLVEDSVDTDDGLVQHGWSQNNKLILITFLFAALYSLTAYFIPQIRTVNIFGNYLAREWLFSLSTSPGYISIGLIVPPVTTLWIFVGCLIGWGILSPLSKFNGWAPGSVSDWESGSRGWIMWIAVALILGDTAITLSTMLLRSFNVYMPNLLGLTTYLKRHLRSDNEEDTQPLIRSSSRSKALPLLGSLHYRDDKLTTKVYLIWILAGLLLCFASMIVLFGLAVAGVVEASVWQAAEMMDEFKMGHLVNAPPMSLFYGQLIGSLVGSAISTLVYRLYTNMLGFPSKDFPMPSAHILISTARLVYGRGMPPGLLKFGIVASVLGATFKILKDSKRLSSRWSPWVPSSVALAAGTSSCED